MAAGKRTKNTVKGSRRGSAWPDEVREKCLLEYGLCHNYREVAKNNGVSESTIATWVKGGGHRLPAQEEEKIKNLREEKIRKISEDAAGGATVAVQLLKNRLRQEKKVEALRQKEVDAMLAAIKEGDFEKYDLHKAVLEKLPVFINTAAMTKVFNALVEKGALLAGEPTENVQQQIEIKLDDECDEYAD